MITIKAQRVGRCVRVDVFLTANVSTKYSEAVGGRVESVDRQLYQVEEASFWSIA